MPTREEIIDRCKAKVAARSSPPANPADIDHGVPMDATSAILRPFSGGGFVDTSAPMPPQALLGLCRYLVDRVFDLTVRVETMRTLMVERGPVSESEFEAARLDVQSRHEEIRRKLFADAGESAEAEKMRRFLEEFEGIKQ